METRYKNVPIKIKKIASVLANRLLSRVSNKLKLFSVILEHPVRVWSKENLYLQVVKEIRRIKLDYILNRSDCHFLL